MGIRVAFYPNEYAQVVTSGWAGQRIKIRPQMRRSVMNKWLLSLLLIVLMLGLTGCEMFSSGDEYGSLTFENASRSIVYVYALSTAWSDFVLPPGELVKMDNIRDTDYRYEPENKVNKEVLLQIDILFSWMPLR